MSKSRKLTPEELEAELTVCRLLIEEAENRLERANRILKDTLRVMEKDAHIQFPHSQFSQTLKKLHKDGPRG